MKNALYTILCIILLGSLSVFGLPWWTTAVAGVVAGLLFPLKASGGWLAGLLGGFLLWFGFAFWMDSANKSLLSGRIGQLFMGLSGFELLLVTGLLGGILGALGVLTARTGHNLFVKPKPKRVNRYY
jgi:hypothetical protein